MHSDPCMYHCTIHENALARSREYMQNILTYCLHRFRERKRERERDTGWERERERDTFISIFTCEYWAISLQIQVCQLYVLCILYHYIYLYNIYIYRYYIPMYYRPISYDSLSLTYRRISMYVHRIMTLTRVHWADPTLAGQHCFPGFFDQGDIHTCGCFTAFIQ